MSFNILSVVVLVVLVSLTQSKEIVDDRVLEDASPIAKYQESSGLDQIMKFGIALVFKGINQLTMLGLAMEGLKHENVSDDCQMALANLSAAISLGDMNAIQFVDATAKIPPGLTMGSIMFLGSFDQCLDADFPSKNNSNFKGQYCAVKIKTMGGSVSSLSGSDDFKPSSSRNLDLRLDACIPSTCSKRDLQIAITEAIKAKTFGVVNEKFLSVSIGVCQTRDVEDFSTGQIVAMVIFAILGAILVTGTGLDIFQRLVKEFSDKQGNVGISKHGESTMRKVLMSFSIYTNGMKLLNTEQGKDSLNAVNGVRFLSMSWVILGHAYYFINQSLVGNLLVTANFANDFAFQAILNGTVSVDSFFFLSGLLVAYVAIKGLRKSGKINWGLYYFHRIWRLTPAYAAVILFTLLFPLLGSGPTWKDENTAIITNCQKSWWGSLLYINNLYKPEIMCLGHGWYLSNDMQFYVLSPIILMALYKKPYLGFIVNFAFMIASIITPALLCMKFDFPPTTLFLDQVSSPEKLGRYFQRIYIPPYSRMGPYCVGIYAGYFLAGNRKLNFNRITKAILWCLAIACNVSVLYGVMEWNKGHRSSTAIHAFYLSTHRTAWAMGLAWVVVACSTGNGGVVNSILSWKLFVPLGRITYLAYLIHPMIQLAYSGLIRERIMYTDYTHITMYLGFLMISYGCAFGASLAVEAPFLGLEKIMFANVKKETPKNNVVNGVDNKAFQETELSKTNNGVDNKALEETELSKANNNGVHNGEANL